jgi:hypothetical protein
MMSSVWVGNSTYVPSGLGEMIWIFVSSIDVDEITYSIIDAGVGDDGSSSELIGSEIRGDDRRRMENKR